MYSWIVYLHVVLAFAFVMLHGVSALAAFKLRRENELRRIRALLDLSSAYWNATYGSLFLMLIAGVAAGFMGGWWGRGWIWASLGLLVAMSVALWALGTRHFNRVREAAGLPWFDGRREHAAVDPAPPQRLEGIIAEGRPWLLTLIGFGGLAVILWLMMFKPF